jgi:hypothetical protein
MSAAGRKAISDATKKRWAAFHAANQAEKPEQAVPEIVSPKKTASKKTAMKAPTTKAAKKTAPAATQAETEAKGQ